MYTVDNEVTYRLSQGWLLIIIVLTYLLIASYVGIYGGVLW